MIRLLALVAIPLTIFAVSAGAEDETAAAAESRYVMKEADNGFLRMDTRTGRVSFCSKPGREWACEAVEDDMAQINREFDALLTENEQLRDRVERLQRGSGLGEGRGAPRRHALPDKPLEEESTAPPLRLPTEEEMNLVMEKFSDAMTRFMDMIRSWQEEQEGRERL